MPIEPTLSDLFHSADGPDSSRIDVRATIRRSRRARLPRQVAAGAALSLAVVGIGVAGITGVNGFRGAAGASTASDHSVSESSESGAEPAQSGGQSAPGSDSGPASADGVLKRAPVEKLNLCSGQIADVAASATGLQLTVDFADAVAGSTAVSGTATLTNNGTERMVGYTAASPAITLSRDGTVLWHSNGPTIQTRGPPPPRRVARLSRELLPRRLRRRGRLRRELPHRSAARPGRQLPGLRRDRLPRRRKPRTGDRTAVGRRTGVVQSNWNRCSRTGMNAPVRCHEKTAAQLVHGDAADSNWGGPPRGAASPIRGRVGAW